MDNTTFSPTALGSYRVLDMTDEKGFLCGRLLADLGADVIKVEPPGGDRARGQGPFFRGGPVPESSMAWWAFNVNKRGITLNISSGDGRKLLTELVKGVDFLIESFAPGYLDGLGLGYEALRSLSPGLIMVSITPFGQEGPYARYQATDLVLQAMGGFMNVTGYEDGPPMRIGNPNAYLHAGAEACAAALIASHHRAATGEGQHVDVSAQQCVAWTLMESNPTWNISRKNIRRAGNVYNEPSPPMRRINHWPCKDGQVGYANYGGPIFARRSERFYRMMQEKDGAPVDLLLGKDWLNNQEGQRLMTQQDLDDEAEVMGAFFLRHTKEELYDWSIEQKFMLTPVNTPEELLASPQIKAREYIVEMDHPDLAARVPYPGAFVQMSETPCQVRRKPPRIGEHNQEIYMGQLGLSRQELTELRSAGVI